MCGIVGYLGKRDSLPIILNGLKRLEYRGYDSAGIAYIMGLPSLVVNQKEKSVNLKSNFKKEKILQEVLE